MTDPLFKDASTLEIGDVKSYVGILVTGDLPGMLATDDILKAHVFGPFSVLWVRMPCCGVSGGLTKEDLRTKSLHWIPEDVPCPCGKPGSYIIKIDRE